MCPKIKETLRRGISEEIIIKTFVMDPKDRRNIEYWDDKKFVEWFEHGHEEAQPKKKGKIKKGLKGEKPLVRLLPLIDALRNNRYLQIKELYVWGVYLEYSDMLCLQSGIWLGNLVAETSIRELFLDGNNLEAEGATALLTQLAEAAYLEGKERERLKAERMAVAVAQAQSGRKRIDLDAPLAESETHTAEDPSMVSDVNPESVSVNAYIQKNEANTNVSASRKRQTLGKGKNKRKSAKMPPCGPQITHLHMAENSINSIGRGGSFAPARCMQLLKTIIAYSKDLQEIDIFGNDIGQVAGRIVLEGILARKDNNLPRIGLRVTHLINQDTYDMIRKLAPKPKGKKKRGGK
ncbi:Leucine rich repeat ribonuclease inhibitor subtype [Echinococcus multilocularis]|uniref:Leucine rich repeat ribonuclease inhibitor subtype n=1 Tax=Echinococcus multilocularis TaxID=6211 RepID=A0A068YEV2_ECHMU|nr:Leucine rich repeat ribonuclease inhibitor subtype [Echinococcus multilocularis]